MKKQVLFIVVLAITMLYACSKNGENNDLSGKRIELTPDELTSLAFASPRELDEKEVLFFVESFTNVSESDITTRSVPGSFNIIKKTYINQTGEHDELSIATRSGDLSTVTAPIYEVGFKTVRGNGMAVVSGDARFPSVIAYIPKIGDETMMEQSGAADLLRASKASYLYNLIKAKEVADSLKQKTMQKISEGLDIPENEISYEKVEDYIVVRDGATTKTTAVQTYPPGVTKRPTSIAPMVKTNWGQDDPFNMWFFVDNLQDWVRVVAPNGSVTKEFKNVPVGCVNVAQGQMMTYTKPTFINVTDGAVGVPDWAGMEKYPTLTEAGMPSYLEVHVGNLLKYLYKLNKTTSDKDWDGAVIGSSVKEADMLRTMSMFFNYDAKKKFDGDAALLALKNKRLILMLTNDHVFIISGILITSLKPQTRVLVQTNDVYWHANFGWSNECTGYYQLNKQAQVYFEAGSVNQWDYQMDFLNNIRNK